ncbi:hypothetical protein [Streptomyces chartreusis]
MSGNRAVAYLKPGTVEVRTIDHPTLELQDGPGVARDNIGRKWPARGDPQGPREQHLWQ